MNKYIFKRTNYMMSLNLLWRRLFILGFFLICGCAHNVVLVEQQSCNLSDKPWPVHEGHFYDGELHLVPAFERAHNPKGFPSFMNGYSIVFLKPKSEYEKIGLKKGDVILAIDGSELNRQVSPEKFSKIKLRQFRSLKIDRCVMFKSIQ